MSSVVECGYARARRGTGRAGWPVRKRDDVVVGRSDKVATASENRTEKRRRFSVDAVTVAAAVAGSGTVRGSRFRTFVRRYQCCRNQRGLEYFGIHNRVV